jgi:hypothetical protein
MGRNAQLPPVARANPRAVSREKMGSFALGRGRPGTCPTFLGVAWASGLSIKADRPGFQPLRDLLESLSRQRCYFDGGDRARLGSDGAHTSAGDGDVFGGR